MFVDVQNIGIHKGWDRTNIPSPIANRESQVVDELLETQIEYEMKIAYQAEIEFKALYDYAKYEEEKCSK